MPGANLPFTELTLRAQRIELRGIVQGVGFRPFVAGLAQDLCLCGQVFNHSAGVTIEVQGASARLHEFVTRLQNECPPLARIDQLTIADAPVQQTTSFEIVESGFESGMSTPISPDVAVCEQCLLEMNDPFDRRYLYPFVNCTHCGPRFTIVRDIPYDRPRTTMSDFEMCDRCTEEYRTPTNRRFHAQPNACPDCGPNVWFVPPELKCDPDQFNDQFTSLPPRQPGSHSAIQAFHGAIERGQIVAVKGIGGFHLACDASSGRAISKLRQRKGRIDKPFAIMAADIETARRIAHINAMEECVLLSRERPIVLLARLSPGTEVSECVAPHGKLVGIMLPYSPLHFLLVTHRPLVMTSGNLSDEPIVRTNQEAAERLGALADAFLLHNREIHVVCDDSVVQVCNGHPLPIRRSRGFAPAPITMPRDGPSVLAMGGELKSTFCATRNEYAYVSQHIGDMGHLATRQALQRTIAHFQALFRIQAKLVACDLHPGYLSTQLAHEYAAEHKLPVMHIQHHHAHVASLMAEHGLEPTAQVIGVVFDGTGYGTDGAIWGGEFLLATVHDFQRFAHLKYVPLPGGDAGVKRPYRAALAQLYAAGIEWDADLPCCQACDEVERNVLLQQLRRNLNCVATSSMGRLYDAVASLVGVRQSVNYEAQAAIELEAVCHDNLVGESSYGFDLTGQAPIQIDPAPAIRSIIADYRAGLPVAEIASRFHAAIVRMTVDVCERARNERDLNVVALSGGVFQNRRLLQPTVDQLRNAGFDVLVHRIVPPNDGGLALGQAWIATCRSPTATRTETLPL